MLLEGLHIPLTTPFHADGRLHLHKLTANVERYSRTPAAGLIVLGPSGEPTLLNDDETRQVLRTAAQAAAPEKVLIAGISRDSVRSTLELADYAASLGFDAVLVCPPTFLGNAHQMPDKASKIDLLRYAELKSCEQLHFFQTVADRSPLPLVLNSHSNQSVPIPNAVKLAAHPNIIGMIDAGRATEIRLARIHELLDGMTSIRHEVTVTHTFAAVTARMKQTASLISASTLVGKNSLVVANPPVPPTLRTRTKPVGFQILTADIASLVDLLNVGTVGIAPAFAAAAPQACYEVIAAWKDNDQPLADEKQVRIHEAAAMAESLGPGGLKFACDLNGYFGGVPRLPHLPPSGEQRATLEQLMQPLRS